MAKHIIKELLPAPAAIPPSLSPQQSMHPLHRLLCSHVNYPPQAVYMFLCLVCSHIDANASLALAPLPVMLAYQ